MRGIFAFSGFVELQLKKLELKEKKYKHFAVEELTKGFPTIPLSGLSKLAARSLHNRLQGSSHYYIF
jgi:hypothetical protein